MPELPEVETMCRGIAPILGMRVAKVERVECKARPIAIRPRIDQFRRRAEGKIVSRIERRGKRVVVWLAEARSKSVSRKGAAERENTRSEESIVIEPRMTGLVLLSDPPTMEHLRFRIRLEGVGRGAASRQLLFWDRRGLGTVSLLSAEEFAERFEGESKTLGPDALVVSAEQLRERLRRSRRAIKVALLDQKSVAGIGNLYASEILYLAGVHPAARCDRIRAPQWERIHAAMLEVLNAAIEHEGSTLSDGTYRNALNQSGGYQHHHRVYDRAGEACGICGMAIRRIVQAQRSTFFCVVCQPRT